jgi:hypothetical protein
VDWLGAHGIGPHVRHVVVGEFDGKQARAYYRQCLDGAEVAVPSGVAAPSFDNVCRVCGGHMLNIYEEYLRDVLQTSCRSGEQEVEFSGLANARVRRDLRLYYGRLCGTLGTLSKERLHDVYTTTIHWDGWRVHAHARRKLGDGLVRALIDSGLVHLRPKRPIVEGNGSSMAHTHTWFTATA